MIKLNRQFFCNGVDDSPAHEFIDIDYQTNIVTVKIFGNYDYEIEKWELLETIKKFQREEYIYN